MAVLAGQVYNLRYKPAEGEKKEFLALSLGHRKAFVNEGEKPFVFTDCVCHMSGIIKILKDNFTGAAGKPIILYGHFMEHTWMPEVGKTEHQKYIKELLITKDTLESQGFRFQEGSPTSFTVQIPIEQTRRELVITGFEFVGAGETKAAPAQPNGGVVIKVAAGTANTASTGASPATVTTQTNPNSTMIPTATDDDTPF